MTSIHLKSKKCIVALSLLCAAQAYADNPTDPVVPIRPPRPDLPRPVVPRPSIRIPDDMVENYKRGLPLLYQAFALKDPNTGNGDEKAAKSISPDTLLTFPDGRKVKAGDYYNELNKFEQHINQRGFSLRENGDTQIPLSGIKLDRQEFDVRRRGTIGKHDPQRFRPRLPIDSAKRSHDGELARIPELREGIAKHIRLPHPQPPKEFHSTKAWSDAWGWSNKFAAAVDTNLKLDGTSNQVAAAGEGNASGFLFGQNLKIIRGTANFVTPSAGDLTGDVDFYFLGYKLFTKNYKNQAAYFFSTGWSKGLDESTTIHFALGPIPMSAKLGAVGTAGLDFRMGILPLHANVDMVPGVGTKVYIQVGVDIVVGGAGGGSDLVLLNDSLDLEGRLHLLVDSKGPYFASVQQATNEVTTLAGRVYAYVYIYVPRWGIPPWKKKQWDWNIFQLDGITAKGSIFSEQGKIYLY